MSGMIRMFEQSQCYQDCGNDPWVPLNEKCPAGLVVTGGYARFFTDTTVGTKYFYECAWRSNYYFSL